MRDSGSLLISFKYRRHAQLQCNPLSWLISSLLKQSPGIRPHFFNQKMEQKELEKNMPSTAANVIMRLAKLAAAESHHLSAHYVEASTRSGAKGDSI